MTQDSGQGNEPEPKQLQLMRQMVALAVQRNEMSAERSYMNAERTLASWIRVGLGLMVFGVALDRFGLVLEQPPAKGMMLNADVVSAWGGVALVAFGTIIVWLTGARFAVYQSAYRRNLHELPYHHGPFLAPFFALMTGVFGLALIVLLVWLSPLLQI